MVENADCGYSRRKLIFVEHFRTDQLTRLTRRKWTGSVIEIREWQEPTKLGTLRLRLGLVYDLSFALPATGIAEREPSRMPTNRSDPIDYDPYETTLVSGHADRIGIIRRLLPRAAGIVADHLSSTSRLPGHHGPQDHRQIDHRGMHDTAGQHFGARLGQIGRVI